MTDLRQKLTRRIQAAQGRIDCDLIVRGVRYLDVFSCTWHSGDLALIDGTIVALEPGLKARREIDGRKLHAVPGFIDAHVHVESSLMVPWHFQDAVVQRGTTAAVCDPHEIANVEGISGLRFFLEASKTLDLDLRVMLSSCVPATHLETNGGGTIGAPQLQALMSDPRSLGLAEMMNMPGVLGADANVIDKLTAFAGTPVDGHSPLLRGKELSAYAAAGISSCHESSELEEAREKLTKGMAVWIREGSVAKDLDALIPLLNPATSTSIGFCTDDRNPLDILSEGHIDHLIRSAIRTGVAPEIAYRSASWTVALHYGLDRGPVRTGALAPGYRADIVLLEDPSSCAMSDVLVAGRLASELGAASSSASRLLHAGGSVRATAPAPHELLGPSGRVHVIRTEAGKILTGREVRNHDERGVARLSVLERYGHASRPANAYVSGFGERFTGAIGSSVGHDSHNLIVAGSNADDMSAAFATLIAMGGGFCVVKDAVVVAKLALPYAGLMAAGTPEELRKELLSLRLASRGIGCDLPEPFLQLAFLSLPVIPSLKLTDKGLVDVDRFQLIGVAAS